MVSCTVLFFCGKVYIYFWNDFTAADREAEKHGDEALPPGSSL